MTTLDAPRLLPLEGGFNLRDMGGYGTRDGRSVKRGMLYRSGIMSMLTEADERHLVSLGIATVCDFRRPGERKMHPTRWCEPAGVHYYARDYSEASGVLSSVLRGEGMTADDVRTTMISLYPELLVDHAPSYRYMFERLLAGHAPLLFNCTVGKDRTGVAAALILSALDVPQETIVEDYAETNKHMDPERLMQQNGRDGDRFRAMDRAVLTPLFAADPAYIATMFDALDAEHGGLDGYLVKIGVDAAGRDRLRDLLLD